MQARIANAASDQAKKAGTSKAVWEDLMANSQSGQPITLRSNRNAHASGELSEEAQLEAAMQASMQTSGTADSPVVRS